MSDPSPVHSFLRGDIWRQRFEEEVLAAARSMAAKCRDLCYSPHAQGGTLNATVSGQNPQVSFWPTASGWDMETSCSCELGSWCHHCAGLLIKAGKTRDLERLSGGGIRSAVHSAIARPAAPPVEHADWPQWAPQPSFELHISRQAVDPNSKLILQSLGQADAQTCLFADAFVLYDGHRLPLRSAKPDWVSELALPDGRRALLRHDKAAENAAARLLSESGMSSLESNSAWQFLIHLKTRDPRGSANRWFPDPSRIPVDLFWHRFRGEWEPRLRAEGWSILVDDNVGHRVIDGGSAPWQSRLTPRDGGWFDLSVGFEVGGERHDLLPILAQLLESGQWEQSLEQPADAFLYAPLPDGDALKLPVGRLRQIMAHLESLINPGFPEHRRLHAIDAARLMEPLAMEAPPDLGRLIEGIRHCSGLGQIAPPDGLQATLRDYQLAGFRWMQWLARHGLHGILADDMGLGKTLQTLSHLLAEKGSGCHHGKPSLVIAPTSVVPNWVAEAKKFAPGLKLLVLDGPRRRSLHPHIPHADLVLSSYALLHRDIGLLEKHDFHLVVLDEAQQIKNPRAKVSLAACRLQAACRLCLSGTPVENHLGELWSLMKFLVPGLLGREEDFNRHYRPTGPGADPTERLGELKRRVAPLILRRTKDQVATELPPKTEIVHRIELHTGQKDLYETIRAMMNKRVRQAIAARGGNQYQIVFLDALLKLRQVCCDPRLLPTDLSGALEESAKLHFLSELLEVLVEEQRRILIFSQFTTMLGLIAAHLEESQIAHLQLTGASKDRGALVERFQSGEVPVFLISLKAGGTGLNLTAADTVIHYDPWWNPAAEAQATDRAYRIGQDKPVFVHKLLCMDTVEERIHQLQQDKARLAAGLLRDADISDRLGPEMMQALLE